MTAVTRNVGVGTGWFEGQSAATQAGRVGWIARRPAGRLGHGRSPAGL